jgi:diguanylate cyclase (GGDEF)-like protein
MKVKKNDIILLILAFSITIFLSKNKIIQRFELSSFDFFARLKKNTVISPNIVIIEITSDDILKIGSWPWKKNWYAKIIHILTKLGAKNIYLDMIISEISEEKDDIIFKEELKINKNTFLPFKFLTRFSHYDNTIKPPKQIIPYLKGMGAINIYPDMDGIVRKIPLFFLTNAGLQPHISLQIAMDYLKADIKDIGEKSINFSSPQGEFKIPLTNEKEMLINWVEKWQTTFKHYTFSEVIIEYENMLKNQNSKIKLNDFQDSICLIGIISPSLSEVKPIPLGPEWPNVAILSNAISNILKQNFLYSLPNWINIFILMLLVLIPTLLITGKNPFKEIMFLVLIILMYFLISLFLIYQNIVLEYSLHFLGFSISTLFIGTYRFICTSKEREHFFEDSITDGLTNLYNIKYFTKVLKTEITLSRKKFTSSNNFSIIMIDIDHFKHFNDSYGHLVGDLVLKKVASVLKTSVRSTDVVARYGGEEMIILLKGIHLQSAQAVSEKIRKNIESSKIKHKDNIYKVTISLGVATFHFNDNVSTIIERADKGLYKAKESGRNRSCSVEKI